MLPNKKAFYIFTILGLLIGYFSFSFIQKTIENKIKEDLCSIKSFYGHYYTIKSIEKRLEITTKARVSKNDFIIKFNETNEIFRTYTQPTTNPEELNFRLFFTQKIKPNDKVYVLTMIPIIEKEIYNKFPTKYLLKKDYHLIFNIIPANDLANSKYYDNEMAISEFLKIQNYIKIIWMVLFLLLSIFVYYKKYNKL